MIERISFLKYPVDNLNNEEIINFVLEAIHNNTKNFFAVQNANKMYLSDKDKKLASAISKASVILPENAINIGMNWLGHPLKQRNLGGLHVMELLLNLANKYGFSTYFLGTTEKNVNILISAIGKEYPNIKILGQHNGFFSNEQEKRIIENISFLKPNFLFVGMGSPKQEYFISQHLDKLNSNVCIGVGGSFNVIAGLEKPAPMWTKYGIEWLYRSFQDPKKIKRYLIVNSYFVFQFLKFLFSKETK